MAIEKIKILATALPIKPIHRQNGSDGLNWQCCLAGSSKTAPMIWIFSIAMGADYSFDLFLSSIECPNFSCIIKSILGGVNSMLSGIKVKSQVLDADCQNIKGYEIQALKSHQCNDAMQTQPIFQKRIFIKSLFIFIRIFCTIFA